jgi:hypothetical protein
MTGMSTEHAPICCMSRPPDHQSPERTDTRPYRSPRRTDHSTGIHGCVTLIVTSSHDIPKIKQALDQYAAASGARINIQKSKAIAVGSRDTAIDIMDIQYHTEMKILGTHFTTSSLIYLQELVRSNGKDSILGSRRVLQGFRFGQTDTLCTHLFTSCSVVHCTEFSDA